MARTAKSQAGSSMSGATKAAPNKADTQQDPPLGLPKDSQDSAESLSTGTNKDDQAEAPPAGPTDPGQSTLPKDGSLSRGIEEEESDDEDDPPLKAKASLTGTRPSPRASPPMA